MKQKPMIIDLSNSPEYQPLLNGDPQTCGMRAGRVHLSSGQSCGEHTTGNHEETLVFLGGEGRAFLEDHSPLPVGAGKVCYVPPNTKHNIENTGSEPLVYIYCVAPIRQGGTSA